jgi:hypothetical protein
MLMAKEERDRIEKRFEKIRQIARSREDELFKILSDCNEEELFCMKFLYAYMPLSDLANYNGELFLQFVRHGLKLRERVPWVKKLDTFIFLNYVLQYRVNNEDIEFYNENFFCELYPRIEGKSLEKAVVEINYWCYEKATYQSSDIRTLSPLSVIRNTYGRCGEESVLAVAAYRSVGIPARQCYAPFWAHCDDNHAWVEVYIKGEWKYLGACEPEENLNNGWFVQPASRAMLIHSRIFSPFTREKTTELNKERLTELNITSHYAKTKEIKVQVFNRDGSCARGIEVHFQVINYGTFSTLTVITTDEFGCVYFETGLGDLFIYGHNRLLEYGFAKVDVRSEDGAKITLGVFREVFNPIEITMNPPMGEIIEVSISSNCEEEKRIKAAKAAALRKAYENTFFNSEKAKLYAEKLYNNYTERGLLNTAAKVSVVEPDGLKEILIYSRGNHKEITSFLEEEETFEYLEHKLALLQSLRKKDLTDVRAEELKDFLLGAMLYEKEYTADIFIPYLLCPRVYNEKLTAHREKLMEHFSKEEREEFRRNPSKAFYFVQNRIRTFNELEYASLNGSVIGAITLRAGSDITKKLAVVTILRVLGIPARMEPLYLSVEFFKDGIWHSVCEEGEYKKAEYKKVELTLRSESDITFLYHKNYSIAWLNNGVFKDLELEEKPWKSQVTYELRAGEYRIMTVNRQADGRADVLLYTLILQEGEKKSLNLLLKETEIAQKNKFTIKDRIVYRENEEHISLSKLLKQRSLVLYLDLGKEPTEHLLNELMDTGEEIYKKAEILVILHKQADKRNITFQKTLHAFPSAKILIKTDTDDLEDIYDAFSIVSKQLPLAVVTDEKMTGIFAMSGYHVGIGELLLHNL